MQTKRLNKQYNDPVEDYICTICLGPIVGAAVVDCEGGGGHSFCNFCIQESITSQRRKRLLSFESTQLRCPNCGECFTQAIPCRALDVAVYDAVDRSIILSDGDVQDFHDRLESWKKKSKTERDEQSSRCDSNSRRDSTVFWSLLGGAALASLAVLVAVIRGGR